MRATLHLASIAVLCVAASAAQIDFQFGEPSVWSLEQAHYLLARMRQLNQDLPTAKPSPDDLSTNGINGTRVQLLQQMLGVQAGYSQIAGRTNKLLENRFNQNESRRPDLEQQRAALRVSRAQVQSDLEAQRLARAEFGKTCPDTSSECFRADGQIKALETKLASIDGDLKINDEELKSANSDVPDFKEPPTASSNVPVIGGELFGKLIDQAMKTSGSPKLHASTMLDNFLSMQYEIIAKQVSLLRDDMGPNMRLMFLELPQSLIVREKRFLEERRVAQTYWRIKKVKLSGGDGTSLEETALTNYTRATLQALASAADVWKQAFNTDRTKFCKLEENSIQRIGKAMQEQRVTERKGRDPKHEELPDLSDLVKGACQAGDRYITALDHLEKNPEGNLSQLQLIASDLLDKLMTAREEVGKTIAAVEPLEVKGQLGDDIRELRMALSRTAISIESKLNYFRDYRTPDLYRGTSEDAERRVRVVDLIPSQSAMNVNTVNATSKGFALTGKFLAFAGLGVQADFQRRRDLYEQFLYQDVFASGFGKGSHEFSWRFGALPGQKQLNAGVRTTYAVLAVPSNAVELTLEVWGCVLKPKSDGSAVAMYTGSECTPEHGQERTLRLPVRTPAPVSFDVTRLRYSQTRPGRPTVVFIHGRGFSPQTAVVADGVALERAISVSDMGLPPFVRERDGHFHDGQVTGSFEVVNSGLIAVALKGKNDYEEFPELVLFTPDASISLKTRPTIQVYANGTLVTAVKWWEDKPLFVPSPPPPPSPPKLALKSVDLAAGATEVHLGGWFPADEGLKTTVFVANGNDAAPRHRTMTLAVLPFRPEETDVWSFMVYQRPDGGSDRLEIQNPLAPPNDFNCRCQLLPSRADAHRERRPEMARIVIHGNGLRQRQVVTIDGGDLQAWRVVDSHNAVVDVANPSGPIQVHLAGESPARGPAQCVQPVPLRSCR